MTNMWKISKSFPDDLVLNLLVVTFFIEKEVQLRRSDGEIFCRNDQPGHVCNSGIFVVHDILLSPGEQTF